MLTNVGGDMLYEAKSAASSSLISSADTVDCSSVNSVASGQDIKIVSVTDATSNQSYTPYVTWTRNSRKFTFDGGISGTNVDVGLTAASAGAMRFEYRAIN